MQQAILLVVTLILPLLIFVHRNSCKIIRKEISGDGQAKYEIFKLDARHAAKIIWQDQPVELKKGFYARLKIVLVYGDNQKVFCHRNIFSSTKSWKKI